MPPETPTSTSYALGRWDLGELLPSVAGLPDGFVAIWSDASAQPPDVVGSAVRARVMYLP